MSKATAAAPERALRTILLTDLRPSPHNPRKRFDAIDELAASIRQKGIRVPLLARPVNGHFEIVAGERRFKAAQLAGLLEVPAIVEPLSDHDAREIQILENLQRVDVHPLDEADAFRDLMVFDKAYTVEAIAAKVGKSASYVYQRLKLTELIADARAAYEADEITAGHAVRLARLSADRQAQALPECFYELFGSDADKREPAPLSKLDRWIQKHDQVNVTSPETQHYFPEVAAEIADEAEPAKLLQLSRSHQPGADLGTKDHGLLGTARWTPITDQRHRCPNVQRGVVVHAGPLEVLEVCATKGCPKHFPVAKKSDAGSRGDSTAAAQKQREEHDARERTEREAREAWDALRPVAITALADHLKGTKLDAGLLRASLSRPADIVELIGALTPAKAGQALALDMILSNGTWSKDRFLQAVKPFKFNVGKVEQAMKAKASGVAPRAKSRR